MKTLLLSVLAVAMIGVMIPSVFGEEVPDWIKNTVGWWAEDKIGDDEFLNAIQYLIENEIIQLTSAFDLSEVPSSFGNNIETSKSVNFELPTKYEIVIHQFKGKTTDVLLGQAQIIITTPDKTTEKFFSPIKNGKFGLTYQITNEHQVGTYFIKAYSNDEKIWQAKFTIHEKTSEDNLVPNWIKNNGKWWVEGKILDSAFLDGMKYLVENEVIVIETKEITQQGSMEKCDSRMLHDGTEILSYLWSDGKCYNVPESELFSFDYESEMSSVCPSEYPHLWSDGNCWNFAEDYEIELECSSDYPYLWSNGYCYNVPECTNNYPHRHSDGQCYNIPEEYELACPVSHPYEWSDGMCYTLPEDFKLACPASHPYEWSDGSCWNLPECTPSQPYRWSDGQCHVITEPLMCPANSYDTGFDYCCPDELWTSGDGVCRGGPACPAGYYEADSDVCCPHGWWYSTAKGCFEHPSKKN